MRSRRALLGTSLLLLWCTLLCVAVVSSFDQKDNVYSGPREHTAVANAITSSMQSGCCKRSTVSGTASLSPAPVPDHWCDCCNLKDSSASCSHLALDIGWSPEVLNTFKYQAANSASTDRKNSETLQFTPPTYYLASPGPVRDLGK